MLLHGLAHQTLNTDDLLTCGRLKEVRLEAGANNLYIGELEAALLEERSRLQLLGTHSHGQASRQQASTDNEKCNICHFWTLVLFHFIPFHIP